MAKSIIKEIEENIEGALDLDKSKQEETLEEKTDDKEGILDEILDEKIINEEEVLEDIQEAVEEIIEEPKKELKDKKLKEAAEAESQEGSEIEKKKKLILEKVAKLKEKLTGDIPKIEELKEQIKGKKKTDMLIPLDDYVKSGIYLGTRVVTPEMKPFVYRRRADGLAIFNTDLIDEKLKEGIEYLSKYSPEEIILVCKRQSGWRVTRMFSELTGIRVFTKKYPAGILTNTQLKDFFENELTIITDSWLDKNALNDTITIHKKVLMICDTNNFGKNADKIIIGNNKSSKSLGVIFYILARGYCKAKGINKDIPDLEWWVGEEE